MNIDWKDSARRIGARTADVARGAIGLARRAAAWSKRAWPKVRSHRWTRRALAALGRLARLGLRLGRIGAVAAVIAGLTLFVLLGCLEPVRPGQIGVRARKWGGAGVEARDLSVGLHWSLPGVHGWHFLPSGTRILNFTWSASLPGEGPELELRTSDGNPVSVLCAVPYRIIPGMGHRIVSEGLMVGLEGRVRTAAEKVLVQELSGLSAEQLTSPDARAERLEEVQQALAAELAALFVEPEGVFVHGIYFAPLFEKKLQQKEITRQWSLQAAVGARVEEAKRKVELLEEEIAAAEQRIAAETDRALSKARGEHAGRMAEERADAKAYGVRRRAEAEAEVARTLGDEREALERVEAKRFERLAALRNTPGGRVWLARRAAQRLKLGRVVLDASDPRVPSVLDLDGMVRLLLGAE